MKRTALFLAFGALLFTLVAFASRAYAGPVFEDPQACLNGNLLMVEPTTAPIEVWVVAGKKVDVDLNIVNCGGNPAFPALEADHLSTGGGAKQVTVTVETATNTDVLFFWDGESFSKNSGNSNWVTVELKVK